jgi:hypothetical protein
VSRTLLTGSTIWRRPLTAPLSRTGSRCTWVLQRPPQLRPHSRCRVCKHRSTRRPWPWPRPSASTRCEPAAFVRARSCVISRPGHRRPSSGEQGWRHMAGQLTWSACWSARRRLNVSTPGRVQRGARTAAACRRCSTRTMSGRRSFKRNAMPMMHWRSPAPSRLARQHAPAPVNAARRSRRSCRRSRRPWPSSTSHWPNFRPSSRTRRKPVGKRAPPRPCCQVCSPGPSSSRCWLLPPAARKW